MTPTELVAKLRDVSREKTSAAWSRTDGGQDLSIGAMLADRAADEIDRLQREVERLSTTREAIRAEAFREAATSLLDASHPLPFDRDALGRMAREAWVRWAQTQPTPKPSWLVPYDDLAEPDKEADRQIGEAIARWTLIGEAAAIEALATPETETKPLTFAYVNYRGEASMRRVTVQGLRWGSTEWHPEPQWLLSAFDLDKRAVREFAVKDMRPATCNGDLQVGAPETEGTI